MRTNRIHIAVRTRDLGAAVAFYETLFGCGPVKLREDYAKFEVADPSVNFTLNRVAPGEAVGHRGAEHFGIQVGSTAVVKAAHQRLDAAGIGTKPEESVTCCYAVQDKVWAVDPDGHRWEIFVTHADADTYASSPAEPVAGEAPCCAPSCCK